ncbi:hypothetical protein [Streptosporangium vulgare]|uniref:hypothetical protein n=1 Tax=Streptosporangium vulgare TaxID=46190 RepID=UPI0031CE952D
MFLSVAAAGAGGLLLTGAGLGPSRMPSRTLARDPFTLGIASGDPSEDGSPEAMPRVNGSRARVREGIREGPEPRPGQQQAARTRGGDGKEHSA